MSIIPLLLFISSFGHMHVPHNFSYSLRDTCKSERDSLTGRIIYSASEIEPEWEGGQMELLRRMNKRLFYPDSAFSPLESTCIVAFIVETNGHITAGRVIRGNKRIGKQMLQIAAGLKWSPGKCHGKNVPTMFKLPAIIEFSKQ